MQQKRLRDRMQIGSLAGGAGQHRRDKMTDIWERAPEGAEYYSANSNTYYKTEKGSVQSWGDESIEWYDHDTPFNNFESPNFIKRPTTTQERKDG